MEKNLPPKGGAGERRGRLLAGPPRPGAGHPLRAAGGHARPERGENDSGFLLGPGHTLGPMGHGPRGPTGRVLSVWEKERIDQCSPGVSSTGDLLYQKRGRANILSTGAELRRLAVVSISSTSNKDA